MKNILILIVLMLGVKSLCAEPDKTGFIEGNVLEKSTRQPLYGVNIILLGTQYGAASDNEGKFRIENIPAGSYQIKASMIGFESQIKTQVVITTNRVTSINFELTTTTFELEKDIEVTAGYFEKNPDMPVSSRTISPDEISSSPGSAEDILRIVHTLPGVSASNGTNANLIVRGGGPDENLTMLDNIEIFSPLHFGKTDASFGIISIVNPDLLSMAEFSSGGFSVQYNGKISSMFDLKLKEGNSTKYNSDVNFNMAGLGVYFDGPVYGGGTSVFSVRRGIFDLITKMLGREALPRYWDAVGKITYNLGKSNKISLVGFYYKDDSEKNKSDEDSHNAVARKYQYLNFNSYGTAFGINWNYLFSSKGFMLTTASVTGNGWDITRGNDNNKKQNYEDLLETEFTLKNEIVYKILPMLEIKGGLQFKSLYSENYLYFAADTTNKGDILNADTIDYNPPSSYKLSSFLQASFIPIPRLTITSGIRYDYFELTKETVLNPRISLSYVLHPKVTLNAAYGKYSQDPSSFQMQWDEVNKNLTSAKSEQYVLGIENIIRNDIKFSIEAYYKKLDNLFFTSDTSRIITNTGSGYAKGIELFLQKKMSDNFVGSVSYTYSVSRRKDNDLQKEHYYKYDLTHNINLVSSYRISDDWQVGLKYVYKTGVPYTPVTGITRINDNHYVIEGDVNSGRLPDYHQLDIRVDRIIEFKNWTLNIYLDLWNVYNRKNIIEYDPKIMDDGTVYNNPINDFAIMPILGISARF